MSIAQALLGEFDHEMSTTKKMLERYPEDKGSWKPHETSMSMSRLAAHMAEIPGWTIVTMQQDGLDMDTSKYTPAEITTRAEALAKFDESVKAARAAIAAAKDETFMKTWAFSMDGKPLFTLPKIAALRGFIMNHMIHHRGQLSVYYRSVRVPVPSLYGPSADEQG
jgi:uncharacterized damage-inducible protein DinB